MYIENIFKQYKNNIKILEYKKGFYADTRFCELHHLVNCQTCHPRNLLKPVSMSSIQRSKTQITDLVLCNEFDLFITFTINPKFFDSKNIALTKTKMINWLITARRSSPKLAYVLVPELHKSGAVHFHVLLKNYTGRLYKTKIIQKGRQVYNVTQWKYGFSTAVYIDNQEAVGYYIQKYITKDMINLGNKKRYWRSTNLEIPKKEYNVDMKLIKKLNPRLIIKYEAEYFKIYSNATAPVKSTI